MDIGEHEFRIVVMAKLVLGPPSQIQHFVHIFDLLTPICEYHQLDEFFAVSVCKVEQLLLLLLVRSRVDTDAVDTSMTADAIHKRMRWLGCSLDLGGFV